MPDRGGERQKGGLIGPVPVVQRDVPRNQARAKAGLSSFFPLIKRRTDNRPLSSWLTPRVKQQISVTAHQRRGHGRVRPSRDAHAHAHTHTHTQRHKTHINTHTHTQTHTHKHTTGPDKLTAGEFL